MLGKVLFRILRQAGEGITPAYAGKRGVQNNRGLCH